MEEKKLTEKVKSLDILKEIPVTVSFVIGKVKMPLEEFLQLEQNQIIRLNKTIDEPIDIYVNDVFFGYGEIVVEDNKIGVKILTIEDKYEE